MNELPYKKTKILMLNEITPKIEKITKNLKFKGLKIINNLEFPNSFERLQDEWN
jgi:transposase